MKLEKCRCFYFTSSSLSFSVRPDRANFDIWTVLGYFSLNKFSNTQAVSAHFVANKYLRFQKWFDVDVLGFQIMLFQKNWVTLASLYRPKMKVDYFFIICW